MTRSKLSPDTRIRTTGSQLSTDLSGESVILDTASGRYFSLDGVGALVWELLQQRAATLGDLEVAVIARYEVSPERCRDDLLTLLDQLREAQLIEVEHDQDR